MNWRISKEAESRWRLLVAQHKQSGLTQQAFAASRGFSSGTFSSAIHALKEIDAERSRKAEAGQRREPLNVGKERPEPKPKAKRPEPKPKEAEPRLEDANKARFVPVRITDAEPTKASGHYEVLFGKGRVLRLPADFDDARVAALVKAVSSC